MARMIVISPTAGMAFDIERTVRSHRAETWAFDTIRTGFGLRRLALDRLAPIMRGADTARPELAPDAAGLLAASLGLRRMFAADHARLDAGRLDAGLALCDAFSRWAGDATEDTQDWPAAKGAK